MVDAVCQARCKRTQHCWMSHVASVCTPCCMLLDVVACCCAKFETGQTFQTTTLNISFVRWLPKRNATMLDPFARSSNIVGATHAHHEWFTKTYGLYPSHDALQVQKLLRVVASAYTTANTHATTPNIVGSCCVRLHAASGVRYKHCRRYKPEVKRGTPENRA